MSRSESATVLRSKEDVVRIVNESPQSAWRMRVVGLIALGGFFIDAYDFTSIAAGAARLQEEFGLSSSQLGFATAVTAAGALVGGLTGGYFVDRIGRLHMFVINMMLFVVATLGAALAPNFETLLVFRTLVGLGVGLDVPVALAFLVEFMAMGRKGKWTESAAAIWAGAAVCGLLFALFLDAIGVEETLWRWLLGVGAVPSVLILLLRFKYMAESPMWAATQGDMKSAAEILTKMYDRPFVAEDASLMPAEGMNDSFFRKFATLFNSKYRPRSVLIGVLSGMQAVQQNSVNIYMPIIITAFFSTTYQISLLASIFTNFCGMLAALAAAAMAERLGLRRITIVGLFVTLSVLLILGFGGDAVPPAVAVLLLAAFTAGHNFGPGSTGQAMSVMSYPTEIRGLGGGLSQASNRVFSLVMLYSLPPLLVGLGLHNTLLLLVAAPAIALVTLAFIRYEPVGESPDLDESGVAGVGR